METRELCVDGLVLHEDVEEKRVSEIMHSLKEGQKEPIIVDRDYGVVLDGHHRVEAARRLGWERIKCSIVDYENEVELGFWREHMRCSKCDVIVMALSGLRFPPKTTRHTLCPKCAQEEQ